MNETMPLCDLLQFDVLFMGNPVVFFFLALAFFVFLHLIFNSATARNL